MNATIIGGAWKNDLTRKLKATGLAKAFDVVSSLADYAVGVTIGRDGSHHLSAPELHDRLIINMLPTCFVGDTETSTFEQSEVCAAHWLVLTTLNRPPVNPLDIECGRVHPVDLTSILGQSSGFAVDGLALMHSGPNQTFPCQGTTRRLGRILNGILLPPMPTDILDCQDDYLVTIGQLILRNREISS